MPVVRGRLHGTVLACSRPPVPGQGVSGMNVRGPSVRPSLQARSMVEPSVEPGRVFPPTGLPTLSRGFKDDLPSVLVIDAVEIWPCAASVHLIRRVPRILPRPTVKVFCRMGSAVWGSLSPLLCSLNSRSICSAYGARSAASRSATSLPSTPGKILFEQCLLCVCFTFLAPLALSGAQLTKRGHGW